MCRHLRRLIPYLRRGYATKYTGKRHPLHRPEGLGGGRALQRGPHRPPPRQRHRHLLPGRREPHPPLPSQLFFRIPIRCACVDGIRKSTAVVYKARPADTLASISDGGIVSPDQFRDANPKADLSDPAFIAVGTPLRK